MNDTGFAALLHTTGSRIYQHGNKGIIGPGGKGCYWGHDYGALSRQPAFVVAGF